MCAKTLIKRNAVKAAVAATAFLISQQAAAAFAVKEQSVTYLGNAFAGTASSSFDASSNWYNPAGLTLLPNHQMVAAATYLNAGVKLYNARATFLGAPVTGENPTQPASNVLIPGLHLAYKLNNCWSFGFSVVSPFGLSTKYSGNSIARYVATLSSLKVVDFTPSIAYKINDKVAVGAGFDAARVIAHLNADTNFGTPGYLNNNATGWGYGFHAGVVYTPVADTKMGLAYFSRMTPHVSGGVSSLAIPGAARTSVTGKINLPDRLVYSITRSYDEQWTVMADVEWTHWSLFKQLKLNYNTGAQVVENYYYQNAFRFALGTNFAYNKCWTFKGGLSYEQTPVTYTYRSARLPDSNRYWVAFGVKYTANEYIALDVGYAHVFFIDAPIGLRTTSGRTLYGNYRNSANLIGAQLTWNLI